MVQKIVLIVGPSGVGKTAAYEAIEDRFPTCIFRHLDGLASSWGVEHGRLARESVSMLRAHIDDDQLFLAFGLESIGRLAGRHPEKNLVVDVGAGFQDAHGAEHLCRVHTLIAITGDPRAIYERKRRHRGEERSFGDYCKVEFSSHRRTVYARPHHSIDTTDLSQEETAGKLESLIDSILHQG